jgi:hypothetical protein
MSGLGEREPAVKATAISETMKVFSIGVYRSHDIGGRNRFGDATKAPMSREQIGTCGSVLTCTKNTSITWRS